MLVQDTDLLLTLTSEPVVAAVPRQRGRVLDLPDPRLYPAHLPRPLVPRLDDLKRVSDSIA